METIPSSSKNDGKSVDEHDLKERSTKKIKGGNQVI